MEFPLFVRFYSLLMVPMLIIAGVSLCKFSRTTGLFNAYKWYSIATLVSFQPLSLQAGTEV